MEKQSFNDFKQHIADWKETHFEEYDLFEEEMNSKDRAGYQRILSLAITLVPAYQN